MRVLPPVYSPLTAIAVMRAAGSPGEAARRGVEQRIEESFAPLELTLTDSGTSALRLVLEAVAALGKAPVAFPAYSCYDLVSAARGARVDPIYYDIDPSTLGPVMESLRRALEMGARSVLIAYFAGVPIDVDSVRALCDEYDALLIEDAAQGIGGESRGRPLGAIGDLAVLSFSRGKGRTGGGGGALLVNTDGGARANALVRTLTRTRGDRRIVARTLVQWALSRPALFGLPRALPFLHLGETRYREPVEPASMSDQAASILSGVWEMSDSECAVRRSRAETYRSELLDASGIDTPRLPERCVGGYLRFPILLHRVSTGFEEAGTKMGVARAYPKILPEIRPAPGDLVGDELPGARLLAERLWTLPTHRFVTDADVSRICSFMGRAAS